jgi:hypothetical protein
MAEGDHLHFGSWVLRHLMTVGCASWCPPRRIVYCGPSSQFPPPHTHIQQTDQKKKPNKQTNKQPNNNPLSPPSLPF